MRGEDEAEGSTLIVLEEFAATGPVLFGIGGMSGLALNPESAAGAAGEEVAAIL